MSAWGEWAAEAEGSAERWAYLYKLSYRRAESLLQMLGQQAERFEQQDEALQRAARALTSARLEIAELSEQLEAVTTELEMVETVTWRMSA